MRSFCLSIGLCLGLVFAFTPQLHAQDPLAGCDAGHAHASAPRGTLTTPQKSLQKSLPAPFAHSDSCVDNNLTTEKPRHTKVVKLKFHVFQDQNGERNYPQSLGSTVFPDVINYANNLLRNNQQYDHNDPQYVSPSPLVEIMMQYDLVATEYYQGPSIQGNSNINLATDAINIYLNEDWRNWEKPTEPICITNPVNPSGCGLSNGSFTIGNLCENETYDLYMWKDGAAVPMVMFSTGPGQTTYTVSGLPAGYYSNIYVERDGIRTASQSVELSDNGGISISLFGTNQPTSCAASNGSIVISGLQMGMTYDLYYELDGTPMGPVSITPTSFFHSIASLAAGEYENIHVVKGGCRSNSIHTELTEPGAPTISLLGVSADNCNTGNSGSFEIDGLTNGDSYTIRFSIDGGTYGTHSFTAAGTSYTYDDLNSGYYNVYVEDANGCRSNNLEFTIIEDCRGTLPGGSAGVGSSANAKTCNVNHTYFTYLARYLQTPPNGDPPTHNWSYNDWLNRFAIVLIHEVGHLQTLRHAHTVGPDDCYDLPIPPVCSQIGWKASNNFMDWICGLDKRNFTECQVNKIHTRICTQNWADEVYTCENPAYVADLQVYTDNNAARVYAWDNNLPPSGGGYYWEITVVGSGDTIYSQNEYIELDMIALAGQTISICVRQQDEDGCLGPRDCETVVFPAVGDCYVPQVSGINVVTNADGIPIGLTAQSLSTKPHSWSYTSVNGSTLSGTCEPDPAIVYSEIAELCGDTMDICVEVWGQSRGQTCTTEVCTTIILPPIYPECPGTGDAGWTYHVATGGSPSLVLEANGFSSPIYEHFWIITDNNTGETIILEGRDVAITNSDLPLFSGSTLEANLSICKIVLHRFYECIVAKECGTLEVGCYATTQIGQITSLYYDAIAGEFVLTYNLYAATTLSDVQYFRNGSAVTPAQVTTAPSSPFITYTARFPYSTKCGTFRFEIIGYSETSWGSKYCTYDEESVTVGEPPCEIEPWPGDTIKVEDGKFTEGKGRRQGFELPGDFPAIRAFKAYPNPTSREAGLTLDFISSASEQVEVSLMDLRGSTVANARYAVSVGDNQLRVALPNVSPGVYLLRMKGSGVIHERVIVR